MVWVNSVVSNLAVALLCERANLGVSRENVNLFYETKPKQTMLLHGVIL